MARYIDLDKLLKDLEDELKDKNPNDIAYLVFKLFIGRLNREPTADVVPKSEVAEIIEETFRRIRENFTISELAKSTLSDLEAELKKKHKRGKRK